MKKLIQIWRRLFDGPESLSVVNAPRRRRKANLDGLYIMRVDFPVTQQVRTELQAACEVLRHRGIEVVVMEPGINLERFDAI